MENFGLKNIYINYINDIFKLYHAIETVIIYGSRATGKHKNGSDIDLTIIDKNLTLTQLLEIKNKMDDLLLPYKIDLSQKRGILNNELLEHIDRVGKIFYTKN